MRAGNLADTFIGYFSPKSLVERKRARIQAQLLERFETRQYEAASHSNRLRNWYTPRTSANVETKLSTLTLRDRARDLVRNNPHSARAVNVITSYSVGAGIVPQIRAKDPTKQKKIEALWKNWALNPKCIDSEQRHDLYSLQSLAMRAVVESGECLVKIHKGAPGLIPYSIQLLEPDFIDSFREYRTEGGYVIQGIEHDKQGRRTAYWLFKEHPGGFVNLSSYSAISEQIPADEILHIYRCERPSQVRGVSWFAPVLIALKDLSDFEDAQLLKQKISACFAVFVRDLEQGIDPLSQNNPDDKNAVGRLEPGSIQYLAPGQDVTFASPSPLDGYGEYCARVLRAISVGLGLNYENLTGDLSQVNFSSGRMGFLDFQRNLELWRWNIMILQFCEPIWKIFLQSLEILGIDTSDVTVTWTPPRTPMIDPSKELESIRTGIRGGLYTLSESLRELHGTDPQAHLEELASDFKLLDKLGLKLDTDPRNDIKPNQPNPIPTPQE